MNMKVILLSKNKSIDLRYCPEMSLIAYKDHIGQGACFAKGFLRATSSMFTKSSNRCIFLPNYNARDQVKTTSISKSKICINRVTEGYRYVWPSV